MEISEYIYISMYARIGLELRLYYYYVHKYNAHTIMYPTLPPSPPKYEYVVSEEETGENAAPPDYELQPAVIPLTRPYLLSDKLISVKLNKYWFGLGDIICGQVKINTNKQLEFQGIGVDLMLCEKYKGQMLSNRAVVKHVVPMDNYPDDLTFSPGYLYKFPFSLLLPFFDESGNKLPPTLNDSESVFEISYHVRVRLIKKDSRISEYYEMITMIPEYDDQIANDDSEQDVYSTTKDIDKNGNSGIWRKLNTASPFTLEVSGPLTFIASSDWNPCLLNLKMKYKRVNNSNPPPKIKGMSYKFFAETKFGKHAKKTKLITQQRMDSENLQWKLYNKDEYESDAQIPINLPVTNGADCVVPSFNTKFIERTYSIQVIIHLIKSGSDVSLTIPALVLYDSLKIHDIAQTIRRKSRSTSQGSGSSVNALNIVDPILIGSMSNS